MRFRVARVVATAALCALASWSAPAWATLIPVCEPVYEPGLQYVDNEFSAGGTIIRTQDGADLAVREVNPQEPIQCGAPTEAATRPLLVMRDIPTGGGTTAEPVNFANSEQLFQYSLIAVTLFWALGICVGAILSVIRNRT